MREGGRERKGWRKSDERGRDGGRVMREEGRGRERGEVVGRGRERKGVTDSTSRLTVHSCRDGLAVEPNSTCSLPPYPLH